MSAELMSRVVKTIVVKHPNIRSMVRNHPYSKVVGMAVVKCIEEKLSMEPESVSDELLEEMIEKGIEFYNKNEDAIKQVEVVEQRRKFLCEEIYSIAQKYFEKTV